MGDGSSDLNVMLHVNIERRFYDCRFEGTSYFASCQAQCARQQRPVCTGAIPEDIVRWPRLEIRDFFERYGFLIKEWESTRTDWLTLRPQM